jgi:hypothetical protein
MLPAIETRSPLCRPPEEVPGGIVQRPASIGIGAAAPSDARVGVEVADHAPVRVIRETESRDGHRWTSRAGAGRALRAQATRGA